MPSDDTVDDAFVEPPWHVNGPPHGRPPVWVPSVVPVVVSGLLQIISVGIAVHGGRPVQIVAGVVALCASALLVLARRAPGPIVAIVAALCTPAVALLAGPPVAAVPLVFAVVIAIRGEARVWVWSSLGAVALIGGIGGYLLLENAFVSVRILIVVIVLCLVVALSEAARARRARYRAASRTVAARRKSAAEAERLRIARELHDVLAHSLSQISVQAGVGLHLFDSEPQRAKESLASIKETSSRALDEVRGVLGMLREDGEAPALAPEPDLASIPELVRTARAAGLEVTVSTAVTDAIPSAVQFVMYRIIQEALTNVVRHSAARTATVTVSQSARAWIVDIADPGPKTHAESETGSTGRGLVGMRERAHQFGGHVIAEAVGAGFRVHVELARSATDRMEYS